MTLETLFPHAKNDPLFRRWVLGSPEALLVEAGIEVPAEMTTKLLDNTPESTFRVLPEAANDDRPDEHPAVADRRAVG